MSPVRCRRRCARSATTFACWCRPIRRCCRPSPAPPKSPGRTGSAACCLHPACAGLAPDGTPLLLLDYRHYYDRPGNPYLGPEGRDWLDNHLRFGLLSRVAAWIGSEASTLDWVPDIIHCNDWQTGRWRRPT
jgi:hypothetical protein